VIPLLYLALLFNNSGHIDPVRIHEQLETLASRRGRSLDEAAARPPESLLVDESGSYQSAIAEIGDARTIRAR
jgi:hypothetical protein